MSQFFEVVFYFILDICNVPKNICNGTLSTLHLMLNFVNDEYMSWKIEYQ